MRERWQGVGKGKGGVGKGRVPPSQAPTGWGGSFLSDLGVLPRRESMGDLMMRDEGLELP